MKKPEKEISQDFAPYQLLKLIGKGGMGEVFLAYDPICERSVALKKIRDVLKNNTSIQQRFLREAKVASQLTHPSIIPIYSIHQNPTYYTMPFVEGDTLKQALQEIKEKEAIGEELSQKSSISSLARVFLHVCEAIAYTHSKGILHRDLKPENIIIGKYGEVFILDWGIADFISNIKDEEVVIGTEKLPIKASLTKPGKIAGTLLYMAPERISGAPSSIATDIYALGIILYQILTLHFPFKRRSLAEFKKQAPFERLLDPAEVAPHRDIPRQLAQVTKKCLSPQEHRYQRVEEMIQDLKNYLEGKPEWILTKELDIQQKSDWEFQENILLAKQIAITRNAELTEWVNLMISNSAFPENLKIEAEIQIKEQNQGFGVLLNVPETEKRKGIEEGYCIWIGSKKSPKSYLFRSQVLVKEFSQNFFIPQKTHHLCVERVDNQLRLFFDGALVLSYLSHLPLKGNHIGILIKDTEFTLKKFHIFTRSHNAVINCLAVPDAFFSKQDYDTALFEYQKIASSFPGRSEGREATFRAGLTLLEKAKKKNSQEKNPFFHLALEEFEKLHNTPGAPLEYLGKSFVYAALSDSEEEANCLELALRKFPKHPLSFVIQEHLLYRVHESSLTHREATYRLLWIGLRLIPHFKDNSDTASLLENVQKNWQWPYFIEKIASEEISVLSICLAFYLSKKEHLLDMAYGFSKENKEALLENTLFALLELGHAQEVEKFLSEKKPISYPLKLVNLALCSHSDVQGSCFDLFSSLTEGKTSFKELRVLFHIIQEHLDTQKLSKLEVFLENFSRKKLSKKDLLIFDHFLVWMYLLQNAWDKSKKIFSSYAPEILHAENSPLYVPYGCLLLVSEGKEIAKIHFSNILDSAYSHSFSFLAYFVLNKLDNKWLEEAFFWEKQTFYRQATLYYHVLGDKKKEAHFQKMSLQNSDQKTSSF
jgi:serine/threonine-protein kinase